MLARALQSIIAVAIAQRRRLGDMRIARRIQRDPNYTFTEDYASAHAHFWQENLREYRGRGDISFLEIGSFEGRSAIWFLENILTHPTASLTCVDSFVRPGGEPRFDHNIKVSGFGAKVIKLKGNSEEILPTLKAESFDVIYIDGCHLALNVLMDAMAGWLLLKQGGKIVFDDYDWEPGKAPQERPQMAIDIFLNAMQAQVELLHKGHQVVVRK